jgi:spore maturation protein CgeB
LHLRTFSASEYYERLLERERDSSRFDAAPDAIVLFGSILVTGCDLYSLIHRARRTFGCLIAAWATDDPYEFDCNLKLSEHIDWLFTNDVGTVPYYGGENVSFLALAAAESVHMLAGTEYVSDAAAEWDFCFCGAAFPNRVGVLEGLWPVLQRYRTLIVGRLDGPTAWPAPQLPSIQFRDEVSYSELLDVYRRSRVVLNLSRYFDLCNSLYQIVPSTPAPRTYEVAAMGIPQFCFFDRPQLLADFAPDELALFDTRDEFDRLAERYMGDYELRRGLGLRSRAKARTRHLYRHRLAEMRDVLVSASRRRRHQVEPGIPSLIARDIEVVS